MSSTVETPALVEAELDELFHEVERRSAAAHPHNLIGRMVAWDEREAESFRFNMDDPGQPWFWQRDVVDWMFDNPRCVVLKARQLGVTWLAGAFGLWLLLYRPGSLVLVYRQKQEEAEEVVGRIWTMLNSLPAHLWNGAKVTKPTRNASPSSEIELVFPTGEVSRLIGMTSTGGAGHGKTAALVIGDEWSRVERAGEIMKAITAVTGQTGRLLIISTANGRHNPETGEGNHFHYLWEQADEMRLARRFLSWRMHPDRDDDWYATSPETRMLRESERLEQYPDNPDEAFSFSQAVFFDKEALLWYANGNTSELLYKCTFREKQTGKAVLERTDAGMISVFREPEEDHRYALAADVATGRGLDWSAAYVVDLGTMELVSQFRGKLDADQYALQLHYLGRWYQSAWLAVEDAGGWGEPVIIFLRHGKDGRPAYPNLYRHRQFSRGDQLEHKNFGYPINLKTRPEVLENLERAVREHLIPVLPPRLLDEMGNFIYQDSGTSPRAADGSHDDCVLAAAVAVELYRQRGHHPDAVHKKRTIKQKAAYPWQAA